MKKRIFKSILTIPVLFFAINFNAFGQDRTLVIKPFFFVIKQGYCDYYVLISKPYDDLHSAQRVSSILVGSENKSIILDTSEKSMILFDWSNDRDDLINQLGKQKEYLNEYSLLEGDHLTLDKSTELHIEEAVYKIKVEYISSTETLEEIKTKIRAYDNRLKMNVDKNNSLTIAYFKGGEVLNLLDLIEGYKNNIIIKKEDKANYEDYVKIVECDLDKLIDEALESEKYKYNM